MGSWESNTRGEKQGWRQESGHVGPGRSRGFTFLYRAREGCVAEGKLPGALR